MFSMRQQAPAAARRYPAQGGVQPKIGDANSHTSCSNRVIPTTCSSWPLTTGPCRLDGRACGPPLRGGVPRDVPLTPLLAQRIGSIEAQYNGGQSRRHRACTLPACRQLRRSSFDVLSSEFRQLQPPLACIPRQTIPTPIMCCAARAVPLDRGIRCCYPYRITEVALHGEGTGLASLHFLPRLLRRRK